MEVTVVGAEVVSMSGLRSGVVSMGVGVLTLLVVFAGWYLLLVAVYDLKILSWGWARVKDVSRGRCVEGILLWVFLFLFRVHLLVSFGVLGSLSFLLLWT